MEPNVSLRLGFVKTASDFKNPILPTLGFQKPNLEGPTTTKISQNRKSAATWTHPHPIHGRVGHYSRGGAYVIPDLMAFLLEGLT